MNLFLLHIDECQPLTANISYPGFGGLQKVCTFKKSCNGLIGWWPSLGEV